LDAEAYASGAEFLARPPDREPDCIILDVRMPGMSGPELRHRLLLLGRPIPTVYITAHVQEVAADPAAAGVNPEVLLKPFDDKSFLASIERCIRPPPRGE
jgi:FixJ family two-component response regulator